MSRIVCNIDIIEKIEILVTMLYYLINIITVDWGCRPTHDTQGKIWSTWNSATKRYI